MEPDTPFDVNVYVPAAACCPTVIVIVACAEFVPVKLTDPVETLQVTLAGAPLQPSETLPVNGAGSSPCSPMQRS